MVRLRPLGWGVTPDYRGGSSVITRGRQKAQKPRGDVRTEAEGGVRGASGQGMQVPLQAGKGQGRFSPRASRRKQPCPRLDFSSGKVIPDFCLQNRQSINMACFDHWLQWPPDIHEEEPHGRDSPFSPTRQRQAWPRLKSCQSLSSCTGWGRPPLFSEPYFPLKKGVR